MSGAAYDAWCTSQALHKRYTYKQTFSEGYDTGVKAERTHLLAKLAEGFEELWKKQDIVDIAEIKERYKTFYLAGAASMKAQLEANENIMKADVGLSSTVRDIQEQTIKALQAQLEAALADVARKDAALLEAIPHLAHPHASGCHILLPTEEWTKEHGNYRLECKCFIARIKSALKAAQGDQHKPKHTNLKVADVARQWLGGEHQPGDPPV